MVSERAAATSRFEAMDVLERANEREDVIHLEVGEPDFAPPEGAIEAAVASLRAGGNDYTAARGKPALREAIVEYYDRRYGVDVAEERVVVTPGSSVGLLLAYLAILDPGDEVVLTDPHYACYPNFVRQAGGRIRRVPLDPADGFELNPAALDRAVGAETGAVMVNSPSNPTGVVLAGSTLDELAGIARRADAHVVSDEAYHGLDYGDRARSALEFTDGAFVVDTFSKRFAMTGWRLGWLVVPPAFADAANRLAQNLFICAPSFVQDAGIAALDVADEFVPEIRATYRERRDFVVDRVDDLGLSLGYTPGGAYYLLLDVRDLGDAFEVANAFLDEAGVAVTPGRDFGERAEPFVRLSYANGMDRLAEAFDRIERFLAA